MSNKFTSLQVHKFASWGRKQISGWQCKSAIVNGELSVVSDEREDE